MQVMSAHFAKRVLNQVMRAIGHRPPDFVIGDWDAPYMRRWFLYRNKNVGCVYLHQVLHDDDDRALHDHPWRNASLVLSGGYVEVMPGKGGAVVRKWRGPGSLVIRRAATRHRLELPRAEFPLADWAPEPCWSLFVTGPRNREWGFHAPRGWIHYQDFCEYGDGRSTVSGGVDGPLSVPGTKIRTRPTHDGKHRHHFNCGE